MANLVAVARLLAEQSVRMGILEAALSTEYSCAPYCVDETCLARVGLTYLHDTVVDRNDSILMILRRITLTVFAR